MSINHIFFIVVMAGLAGCHSLKIDMSKKGDANRVGNKTIVGTWTWTRKINNCNEVWRFYEDGKFAVISGREVILGEYSISEKPNESSRYALHTTNLIDHGGKDCADSNEDDTGKSSINYILFDKTGNIYLPMYHPTNDVGFGPLIRIGH
jgi:hypothetical protein